MADTPSHHLIYGYCRDFVTGESLVDTDDERIRQQLARFLVESKGFDREDLEVRQRIETLFSGQFVTSTIDLVVRLAGRRVMIVRYGPGSLVTRERPAVAAARVLDPDVWIPLAVVSNGRDAELLDTRGGKVLATGLDNIPSREELLARLKTLDFAPLIDPGKRERELRVLNAFDRELCCAGQPCPLPGAPEG